MNDAYFEPTPFPMAGMTDGPDCDYSAFTVLPLPAFTLLPKDNRLPIVHTHSKFYIKTSSIELIITFKS